MEETKQYRREGYEWDLFESLAVWKSPECEKEILAIKFERSPGALKAAFDSKMLIIKEKPSNFTKEKSNYDNYFKDFKKSKIIFTN